MTSVQLDPSKNDPALPESLARPKAQNLPLPPTPQAPQSDTSLIGKAKQVPATDNWWNTISRPFVAAAKAGANVVQAGVEKGIQYEINKYRASNEELLGRLIESDKVTLMLKQLSKQAPTLLESLAPGILQWAAQNKETKAQLQEQLLIHIAASSAKAIFKKELAENTRISPEEFIRKTLLHYQQFFEAEFTKIDASKEPPEKAFKEMAGKLLDIALPELSFFLKSIITTPLLDIYNARAKNIEREALAQFKAEETLFNTYLTQVLSSVFNSDAAKAFYATHGIAEEFLGLLFVKGYPEELEAAVKPYFEKLSKAADEATRKAILVDLVKAVLPYARESLFDKNACRAFIRAQFKLLDQQAEKDFEGLSSKFHKQAFPDVPIDFKLSLAPALASIYTLHSSSQRVGRQVSRGDLFKAHGPVSAEIDSTLRSLSHFAFEKAREKGVPSLLNGLLGDLGPIVSGFVQGDLDGIWSHAENVIYGLLLKKSSKWTDLIQVWGEHLPAFNQLKDKLALVGKSEESKRQAYRDFSEVLYTLWLSDLDHEEALPLFMRKLLAKHLKEEGIPALVEKHFATLLKVEALIEREVETLKQDPLQKLGIKQEAEALAALIVPHVENQIPQPFDKLIDPKISQAIGKRACLHVLAHVAEKHFSDEIANGTPITFQDFLNEAIPSILEDLEHILQGKNGGSKEGIIELINLVLPSLNDTGLNTAEEALKKLAPIRALLAPFHAKPYLQRLHLLFPDRLDLSKEFDTFTKRCSRNIVEELKNYLTTPGKLQGLLVEFTHDENIANMFVQAIQSGHHAFVWSSIENLVHRHMLQGTVEYLENLSDKKIDIWKDLASIRKDSLAADFCERFLPITKDYPALQKVIQDKILPELIKKVGPLPLQIVETAELIAQSHMQDPLAKLGVEKDLEPLIDHLAKTLRRQLKDKHWVLSSLPNSLFNVILKKALFLLISQFSAKYFKESLESGETVAFQQFLEVFIARIVPDLESLVNGFISPLADLKDIKSEQFIPLAKELLKDALPIPSGFEGLIPQIVSEALFSAYKLLSVPVDPDALGQKSAEGVERLVKWVLSGVKGTLEGEIKEDDMTLEFLKSTFKNTTLEWRLKVRAALQKVSSNPGSQPLWKVAEHTVNVYSANALAAFFQSLGVRPEQVYKVGLQKILSVVSKHAKAIEQGKAEIEEKYKAAIRVDAVHHKPRRVSVVKQKKWAHHRAVHFSTTKPLYHSVHKAHAQARFIQSASGAAKHSLKAEVLSKATKKKDIQNLHAPFVTELADLFQIPLTEGLKKTATNLSQKYFSSTVSWIFQKEENRDTVDQFNQSNHLSLFCQAIGKHWVRDFIPHFLAKHKDKVGEALVGKINEKLGQGFLTGVQEKEFADFINWTAQQYQIKGDSPNEIQELTQFIGDFTEAFLLKFLAESFGGMTKEQFNEAVKARILKGVDRIGDYYTRIYHLRDETQSKYSADIPLDQLAAGLAEGDLLHPGMPTAEDVNEEMKDARRKAFGKQLFEQIAGKTGLSHEDAPILSPLKGVLWDSLFQLILPETFAALERVILDPHTINDGLLSAVREIHKTLRKKPVPGAQDEVLRVYDVPEEVKGKFPKLVKAVLHLIPSIPFIPIPEMEELQSMMNNEQSEFDQEFDQVYMRLISDLNPMAELNRGIEMIIPVLLNAKVATGASGREELITENDQPIRAQFSDEDQNRAHTIRQKAKSIQNEAAKAAVHGAEAKLKAKIEAFFSSIYNTVCDWLISHLGDWIRPIKSGIELVCGIVFGQVLFPLLKALLYFPYKALCMGIEAIVSSWAKVFTKEANAHHTEGALLWALTTLLDIDTTPERVNV